MGIQRVNPAPQIIVRSYTLPTVSFTGNDFRQTSLNYTPPAGYAPVGLLGVRVTSPTHLSMSGYVITNSSIYVNMRKLTSGAGEYGAVVDVAFVKT